MDNSIAQQPSKKILFINRQAPHGSYYAKEQLQMAMVFAAYENQVSMLFVGDGIYNLKTNQLTKALGFDNFSKTYASLEKFYSISNIFVCRSSLTRRNMSLGDLLIPVQEIESIDIMPLIRISDCAFNV